MLHDVLMALAGHPGDVVVDVYSPDAGFVVSESYFGISQSERKVINSVVKIGYKYRCLEEFVRRVSETEYSSIVSNVINLHGSHNFNKIKTTHSRLHRSGSGFLGDFHNPRGFYVSALCSAIDEYLEEYRANLVTIEKVVLADPGLPLSTLSILLAEQKEVMDGLLCIVNSYRSLVDRKISEYGSEVVLADEFLHLLQGTTCNNTIKSIYNKLYNRCLATFQMQLKAWICRGQLIDPHNEFMIGRRQLASDDSGEERLGIPDNQEVTFEHLYEELTSEASEFEWNFMFYTRTKEPRWIPCSYRTWKDILFLGKAARMLLRRYHNEKELEEQASHIFNEWPVVCSSPNAFEHAIGQYRTWVAQAFWVYINEDFNARAHFDLFRQVYMLGCHDMYTELLESSWFTMQTPCNLTACTNLRSSFWKSASNRMDLQVLTSRGSDSTDADVDMVDDTNYKVATRAYAGPFQLKGEGGDVKGRTHNASSLFDFRQRTGFFNLDQRRFILCGDTAWIDDEIVLNVSKRRLEAPISNSAESSAAWFENMVHVTDGLETSLRLELCQVEASYMYNEEKMRGKSLGRFARFDIVLQSRVEPSRLDLAYVAARNPWDLLKDSFAIEFVVEYDNLGEHTSDIFVDGCILIGGKCATAVCGVPKTALKQNEAICVNKGHQKFRLSTGSREDFVFYLRLKVSRKHIFVELEHSNSANSLILETDVMDATQTLHHDFGDSYIGVVSSPFETFNAKSKIDISKRNSVIRISQWNFAGYTSKYDMLPLVDKEIPLGHESFQRELPDLKGIEFESGLNDWMYLTMAYRCNWPVSILLDLPTMLCYNSIFQFMFLLRRCVYGLEILCHIHPRMRLFSINRRASQLPDICRRASCIRWRMYLFMTSMLSYVQQCVVERCYKKLCSTIQESESFQVIKAAHDRYLENIAINCFLDEDAIIQPLLRCMDTSMKFATLYYCGLNGSSDIDPGLMMDRLNEFNNIFDLNMVRISERLLLLSTHTKYSSLNTFREMCSFMHDI